VWFFYGFWIPARDPCLGDPLWRGFQRSSFSLLLNKFHDAFIHLLQSDHSLCFSIIALNKHLIFLQFCSFFGPLSETPVWGAPLERVLEELIFTTLPKFHDAFIHLLQSDHSLCFSLIALNKHLIFLQFLVIFGPPARDPCLGPLWRGS
jgi:hypothetical protein